MKGAEGDLWAGLIDAPICGIMLTCTSVHDSQAGICGHFAYREGGGLYIGEIGDDSWVESQGCDFSCDDYGPNSPNDIELYVGKSWPDLGEDVFMRCTDETCTLY